MAWSGHLRTIVPHFARSLRSGSAPDAAVHCWSITDERYGAVRLRGALSSTPNARGIVVAIHGLGGSSQSGYMLDAARSAATAGLACLRIDLRGADGAGEDFYHAGLFSDLDHVLRSPEVEKYDAVYLLGYSLGGHVALVWAASTVTETTRVRAVAAVCPPLDLSASSAAFDKPAAAIYRAYVLRDLKRTYAAVAARRSVACPVEKARRITRMHDWDEYVVSPRYGFAGAEDYYAKASAAPRLSRIRLPTLVVVSDDDPMVPPTTLTEALSRVSTSTLVRHVARAGHMGFPADTDLGCAAARGLEPQVLAWLEDQSRRSS